MDGSREGAGLCPSPPPWYRPATCQAQKKPIPFSLTAPAHMLALSHVEQRTLQEVKRLAQGPTSRSQWSQLTEAGVPKKQKMWSLP